MQSHLVYQRNEQILQKDIPTLVNINVLVQDHFEKLFHVNTRFILHYRSYRCVLLRGLHFRQGPMNVHNEWVCKYNKKALALAYHTMYQKCSRTEVKREFNLKEGKIPWDLSR